MANVEYVAAGYVATGYYQTNITIDWRNKIIFVPKFFMITLQTVPTEILQLNLDVFRLALKDLEDSEQGILFVDTHKHNTTVTVGGVTLARVIEIINGYSITFEDGNYAVNLTGANSNVGDVINVNKVSVRSANSAGLQDLSTILSSAYNNGVAVDVLNTSGLSQSGTSVPLGTRSTPSDNFNDALIIAAANSIKKLQILSSATLTSNNFSKGFTFIGDNPITIVLTMDAGANVANCEFRCLTITGILDGGNTLRECSIQNLSYTFGFLFQCAITGGIDVAANSRASIFECYSNPLLTPVPPIIDMGGTGSLTAHHLAGDFKIINSDGTGSIYIHMDGGTLTLDSTITGGVIYVSGTSDVVDNTTGTTVVNNNTVKDAVDAIAVDVKFLKDVEGGRWDLINNQMIFYAADNITEVARFNMFDSAGNPTTTGDIFKRTRV